MAKKKKTKSQDSHPKAAPLTKKRDVSVNDSQPGEGKTDDEVSPYGGMDLRNFKKNLGCGG